MKRDPYFLAPAALILAAILVLQGLREVAASIKSMKPTMSITQKPVEVRVVRERLTGLLPEVR